MFGFGVDIGGTKCAISLASFAGGNEQIPQINDKVVFPTEKGEQPDSIIEKIMKQVEALGEKHNFDIKSDSLGIGISCGGPLDAEKGIIMRPPNLPLWDNVPIVHMLKDKYHIPVFLENDANACALAEYKFGAGVGLSNMVFLTFGTGLGAGMILNGRIYRGAGGMAGEVGHIRLTQQGPVGYGKAGSFEGYCSGGGIRQIAIARMTEIMQQGNMPEWCDSSEKMASLNAKIIAEQADKGDPVAVEIYRTSGKMLGAGLAILIDLLNPEMIVIGSIFERATHLLWPYAKEVIEKEALCYNAASCKIVPSKLGDNVGDYAALSLLI